jgi:hypothetical protein
MTLDPDQTRATHRHPAATRPNAPRSITLHLASFGWEAQFRGDPKIPEGAWLPLPFTPIAPIATVARDLAQRFPKATLYVVPVRGY